MQFSTPIPIATYSHSIDYQSKIVLLGSCFAENMAAKWEYFKFENVSNPFGIIFNPVSIENIIRRAVSNKRFTEQDVFFHNNLWHCFEVHSELSTIDKEEMLQNLNTVLDDFKAQLTAATHIIITYGTAWVYRNKVSNEIVANCHKVPQNQFEKEILSASVIKVSIENTIDLIKKVNPKCNFIFTISPVRHIKDGFVENQRSKAHLITAIHKIINYQLSITNYFPSYEIIMDELRDYRFYADDMLHPSQTAIDYIWIRFFENYVAQSEFSTMQQVCDIQKALAHRPFNPDAEQHKEFAKKIEEKIKQVQVRLQHIKF
jgi:hypothetical protein